MSPTTFALSVFAGPRSSRVTARATSAASSRTATTPAAVSCRVVNRRRGSSGIGGMSSSNSSRNTCTGCSMPFIATLPRST